MLRIEMSRTLAELEEYIPQPQLVKFLHQHLDQFTDRPSAISKAIDYAFDAQSGKGGFVVLALDGNDLVGVVVMNRTGMDEYVPAYLLVYIAVDGSRRGQGIGKRLMQQALEHTKDGVALHVEYDNPARRLYERLGFSSKYAEMRWNWS